MKLFRNVKKLPAPLAWGGALLLHTWAALLRVRIDDQAGLLKANPLPPTIFLLWHNRMLCMAPLSPRSFREQLSFLASRSRDGGYISDLLEQFQLKGVRGSSSRGGAVALRELHETVAGGGSVLITPDGPRGPCYTVQDGPLWLASATQRPIVPIVLNSRWHIALKSWDRFQIPLPGSHAEFIFGPPLQIPPDLDFEALPVWRQRVRQHLLALTRWDRVPPPPPPSEAAAP